MYVCVCLDFKHGSNWTFKYKHVKCYGLDLKWLPKPHMFGRRLDYEGIIAGFLLGSRV